MLEPGDRVIAGISGGADSVCLLFMLLEWSRRQPLDLAVVHVNHGVRPEAGKDAAYVENLCRSKGIQYYLTEVNLREEALRRKCSQEEAGRRIRYEAFEKAALDYKGNKIAVAHNSNDRSETMLFHLFRGSGIRGLAGIPPKRENIIRPLLCLERGEIEAYLGGRGISWCEDVTNASDDYTRNRIRHHILPFAEQNIASGCVRHMCRSADMLSETEDYLEQQTQIAIGQCLTGETPNLEGRRELMVEPFLKQHPAMQKRVLFALVKELTPMQRDITYVHIRELMSLFTTRSNRSICLPFGIRGRREYERVLLETQREDNSLTLSMEDLDFSLFSYEKNGKLPQNEYTKWFDYDKIEKPLVLRSRQIGDYLTIANREGELIHKSLKDYMITKKIPRDLRESIPVLAQENHVIWLIGYRISEYYKVSENTKRVLQVQLKGKSVETEEKT